MLLEAHLVDCLFKHLLQHSVFILKSASEGTSAGDTGQQRTSTILRRCGISASDGMTGVFGMKGMNALVERGVRGDAAAPPLTPARSVFVRTRRRTVTSLQRDLTKLYKSA